MWVGVGVGVGLGLGVRLSEWGGRILIVVVGLAGPRGWELGWEDGRFDFDPSLRACACVISAPTCDKRDLFRSLKLGGVSGGVEVE